MTWHWLGIILVIYGGATLIMNDSIVAVRRALKPWWRDRENPAADNFLKAVHHHVVFGGALLCLELGLYWSSLEFCRLGARLAIYFAFAIDLAYRQRRFWDKVFHQNQHREYWDAALGSHKE